MRYIPDGRFLIVPPERCSGASSPRDDSAPPLAGQTMDALFRPEGWKIMGNRSADTARFLPAYK